MKNRTYELRKNRPWMFHRSHKPTVSRAALIRAFSTPDRSHHEVLDIVARYIGDNIVPPSWGMLGVRGIFGKQIAKLWARRIKPMKVAAYKDEQSGRWLTPVVQTAYELGTTPEAMREMSQSKPASNLKMVEPSNLLILDEFYTFSG